MTGGGILKAGVSFFANLALVRLLMPKHFGEFAIVQSTVSLVGAFLNFRTGPLLLQAPEKELRPHALARYTGALVAETLLIGGIASSVLWMLGYLSAESVIFLVSSLGASWVQLERSLYERNFEYKKLSILESSAHISVHGMAVAGAYVGVGPLVLYIRKAMRQIIISVGLYWLKALRRLPVRWLTLDDWLHILDRLKGFWTDGLLNRLFDRASILLVGAIAGEQTTGFFFQARKLAFAPDRILGPVTNRVALSHFSHRVEQKNRYRELRKGLLFLGVPLLIASLLVFVFAEPILPWVFGKEWQPTAPILQMMTGVIVGMPLLSLVQAYSMSENSMERFVLSGRAIQLSVLATSALAIWVLSADAGIGFGIAFSLSFVISLVTSVAFAKERK